MKTREEMVAEFERKVAEFKRKADVAVYERGEELVYERITKAVPNYGFDEYFDIQEELARGAYEDDGYTKLGSLTYEEIYFLLIEHYTIDEANEYLSEYRFYELGELEAVA